MESPLITILLAILILGVIVVIVLLTKKKDGSEDEKLTSMSEKVTQLYQQNQNLKEEVDKKLSETHQANQSQFRQTSNIFNQITEKLVKLDETNKQVMNFSSQLQNLQDILKSPKQRGVLGEYYLEEILKNVLPPNSYQMQYKFSDGNMVDAVVFVKDKIIPIDSKFSLETYQKMISTNSPEEKEKFQNQFKKDLKNRIDETAKYVKTKEGTLEFAFMFIPSEAIYYDLLISPVGTSTKDLIEYAFRERKVIIVSPTSFLAYLQTVLQGLKAMQIEESAKEIKANVEKLSRHLSSYEEYLQKLGNSMTTSVNHYNRAYKEFSKIDKDVTKITKKKDKVEALDIEKPKLE